MAMVAEAAKVIAVKAVAIVAVMALMAASLPWSWRPGNAQAVPVELVAPACKAPHFQQCHPLKRPLTYSPWTVVARLKHPMLQSWEGSKDQLQQRHGQGLGTHAAAAVALAAVATLLG